MSRHRAGRLSDTAMAADIEQHKAVAKLWICLEPRAYVPAYKPSPSTERYLQDLLECVQAVAESHCADPTLVRACMRTASTACPGKPSQGV